MMVYFERDDYEVYRDDIDYIEHKGNGYLRYFIGDNGYVASEHVKSVTILGPNGETVRKFRLAEERYWAKEDEGGTND